MEYLYLAILLKSWKKICKMYEVVIADASCIIVLEKIGRLAILQNLFKSITITPEVMQEYGNVLPNWIQVESVQDKIRQQLLEITLDKGEASAIALSLEKQNGLLLIDEKRGRKIAEELNLKLTGTLGILIRAVERGLIPSIRTEIEKLEQVAFRMSNDLKERVISKYEKEA